MPRHLAVVDATHTPAATAASPSNVVELPVTNHPNIARLTAAHDRACQAAQHPLVAHEIHDTAAKLAAKLTHGGDPLPLIIDAIRTGFTLGYLERDTDTADPAEELAQVFHLNLFGGDAS